MARQGKHVPATGGAGCRFSYLIHDRRLILVHEPFGALDALPRERVSPELLRIWSESRKTVAFVTPSIREMALLSRHAQSSRPVRPAAHFAIELPILPPRSQEDGVIWRVLSGGRQNGQRLTEPVAPQARSRGALQLSLPAMPS
jgi:NitT/TauT family transport system ATP-binding protein